MILRIIHLLDLRKATSLKCMWSCGLGHQRKHVDVEAPYKWIRMNRRKFAVTAQILNDNNRIRMINASTLVMCRTKRTVRGNQDIIQSQGVFVEMHHARYPARSGILRGPIRKPGR